MILGKTYRGNTEIEKIYRGANVIYEAGGGGYGSELITDMSAFTPTTGMTYNAGVWEFVSVGNFQVLTSTSIALEVGKVYKVEYTLSDYASGKVRISRPNTTAEITANGTYSYEITAVTTQFEMSTRTGSPHTLNLSAFSCKEVL